MAAVTFEHMASLPVLRKFYGLTWRLFRVNVAILSRDGSQSVCMGTERTMNPFCLALQRQGGRRLCEDCDRRHVQACLEQEQALCYACHACLTEFLIPIVCDRQTVAFLQCGQVLDRSPTPADWRRTRAALAAEGVDTRGLRALYLRTRVVSPGRQKDLVTQLELIGNYVARAEHLSLQVRESRNAQIVARATSFIRSHFAEPVSLEQVAAAAFVSRRTLTRVFRAETGTTVLAVIQHERIARARDLLRQSDVTCLQAALECGFGSVQHFNRVFKSHMAATPQAWRRREGRDG